MKFDIEILTKNHASDVQIEAENERDAVKQYLGHEQFDCGDDCSIAPNFSRNTQIFYVTSPDGAVKEFRTRG